MTVLASLSLLVGACGGGRTKATETVELAPVAPERLRSVADFAGIADETLRSSYLFAEIARVLRHPRCSNCHPTDDQPRQRLEQALHEPPVWRGPDNRGLPAARCTTCHLSANSTVSRVPGAADWHLAPPSMGWIGRSPSAMCEQLKDRKRNGNRGLDEIYEHMATDALVAWGWNPGHGREPAPGSQAELAALTRAWIDTGAVCPEGGER